MKIRCHLPPGTSDLIGKAARIHSDDVLSQIRGLSCSQEQKEMLLQMVTQTCIQKAAFNGTIWREAAQERNVIKRLKLMIQARDNICGKGA